MQEQLIFLLVHLASHSKTVELYLQNKETQAAKRSVSQKKYIYLCKNLTPQTPPSHNSHFTLSNADTDSTHWVRDISCMSGSPWLSHSSPKMKHNISHFTKQKQITNFNAATLAKNVFPLPLCMFDGRIGIE